MGGAYNADETSLTNEKLFISGVNRSDDLFMYWKGQIVGLSPGTSYRASIEVEFATNVPSGCVGVGGSPGESVWISSFHFACFKTPGYSTFVRQLIRSTVT
jgi:hypothetical protein